MNRLFNLASPFGESLRFERLTGCESVSELFEFELTASSEEHGLAPTATLRRGLRYATRRTGYRIYPQMTVVDIAPPARSHNKDAVEERANGRPNVVCPLCP